jgi:hypothetical protein
MASATRPYENEKSLSHEVLNQFRPSIPLAGQALLVAIEVSFADISTQRAVTHSLRTFVAAVLIFQS